MGGQKKEQKREVGEYRGVMEREGETTYRFSLLQLLIRIFLHEHKTQQIAIITHKECWTPLFDAEINNKSTNNAGDIYLYNQVDILACTFSINHLTRTNIHSFVYHC